MPASKQRRGLATLSPARRQEIARKGALALHKKKKAHQFTSETGRAAAQERHQAEKDNESAS